MAVNFFKNSLGSSSDVDNIPVNINLPSISSAQASLLTAPFTNEDIRRVFCNMAKNKCPGPDGFTAEFYITTWSIIKEEVCNAVHYFFNTLHMPRIVNSAAIALVPKEANPSVMSQFRPISCCNVIYKCISKLLASRLKKVLPSLISPNQTAFIPKRSIGDNILLAQALCKDYHLHRGPSRCMVKLDIHKAFDSLNWKFLEDCLIKLGFPSKFIGWIMACISTGMYSIKINGALEGYFGGKSGLRQGDAISPYLFVIAMEVFSACIKKFTDDPNFKFHWRTKDINLSHIIFANDVLLMCKGEEASVNLLMKGVNLFSKISGLKPNVSKSNVFFGNVATGIQQSILSITGFSNGSLPFRYLGLPLIAGKLTAQECNPLVMRLCNRIEVWTSNLLNFAGRLQLIKSVLTNIQGFWSMYLFLPICVLKATQSIFAKFLWGGTSDKRCLYKVSWSDCCLPKQEGGLGIRNMFEWNAASILHQLWRIIQPGESSLWVMWFKKCLLRNKAFWTTKIPFKCSWCVRKILNTRPHARQFVSYQVGNNSTFLLWHDPWINNTPIVTRYPNIISLAESNSLAQINSFQRSGTWVLPPSNHVDVMELRNQILNASIHGVDKITWDGALKVNLNHIWNSIRTSGLMPSWFSIVWHSFAISKCSFIVWLAMKDRLFTKTRMQTYGMQVDPLCLLCGNDPETVEHLFAGCSYISDILNLCPFQFKEDWAEYLQGRLTTTITRGWKSQMAALYLNITMYQVWRERNHRVHNQSGHSSAARILITINRMFKEKLFLSKKFKKEAKKDQTLILLVV